MSKCDICGKKMRWWQGCVIAFSKGEPFPLSHTKCSDEQGDKPYYSKGDFD